LIYGEDPKEGFRQNNVFYHPLLRFQFPIPLNWNYQNTPQMVQMAPQDGNLLTGSYIPHARSLIHISSDDSCPVSAEIDEGRSCGFDREDHEFPARGSIPYTGFANSSCEGTGSHCENASPVWAKDAPHLACLPGKDGDLCVFTLTPSDPRSRLLLVVQDGRVAYRAPKE